jgi:multidrug transporter EmrE-like cation transporter
MGTFFLLLTIVSESAAVIFMKLSNGFGHKGYAIAAVVAYLLSFVLLTFALRSLPVGLANAVWAGASTVIVTILGIYIFKEQLSISQAIFLSLIIIGLIGLHFSRPA